MQDETIKILYHSTDIDHLTYVDGKSDWIDLRSAKEYSLKAGDFVLIDLGISVKLPEGYELAPTDVVRMLKGHSARVFLSRHPEIKNSKFWGGHIWTRSYYMSTVGNMSKEVVERYINDQYKKGQNA